MPWFPVRRPAASLALALALAAALPLVSALADPRPPAPMDAAQLRLALRRLQVTGSALYIAAHPDDENTAFLAWLAQGRLVRAGYLSLTRGDGGQNLIGTELGAELGLIRTHELLGARRIDGAQQWFTRAVDFGYSKGPDETLAKWGRDSILADVVRVIRRVRPDILVTRFPTDGGGGHGHHTASALLAEEAFAAAADPARFPECGAPWQAKRILWNVFRGAPAPGARRLTVDLGAYSPELGRSFTELAGESRTMHKSQGFGSAERRGSIPNSFELRAGAPADSDLFEGVDLTWSRVRGGAPVRAWLAEAERAFDPDRPATSLPALMRAKAALDALSPDDVTVRAKRGELLDVIRGCAGLWLEAITQAPAAAPGDTVALDLMALVRTDTPASLERIELPFGGVARAAAADSVSRRSGLYRALEPNRARAAVATVVLPATLPISQPYWMRAPADGARFHVDDPDLIGLPEEPASPVARFVMRFGADTVAFDVPFLSRRVDPVEGERYRALVVEPPITLALDRAVYVFPDRAPRTVRVTARSGARPVAGAVRLALPAGFTCEPASAPVALEGGGVEQTLSFAVHPGAAPLAGALGARFTGARGAWDRARETISHAHIPEQTLFPPAEARVVRADLAAGRGEVGYVMGSGDAVPEALRQCGYRVTLLGDDDLADADLARFVTIVTGVRAYNTRERLRALQPRLLDWVRAGGTLLVQYNTLDDGLRESLWPYPMRISRDRVTVEEAPVTLLKPGHVLLTRPHAIGAADFEGWVQERGLYFADQWDARYEALLSSHDPGEPARDGGLLAARVGKGMFIYDGYGFFRQIPAGVPGAYRLLLNLVNGGR